MDLARDAAGQLDVGQMNFRLRGKSPGILRLTPRRRVEIHFAAP
jgi:hypothetical protein